MPGKEVLKWMDDCFSVATAATKLEGKTTLGS